MYIKFENVKIKNFQAIQQADVDLDEQGVVLVKGVNDYEDNAKSNGSGKSSLFESIVWCIYGKTSNGITDVKNRYADGGCYVILSFYIDNVRYEIIRSIKDKDYGNGVKLKCEDKDITNKNKVDTEKQIKSIIGFDFDIFLSTVYLSQGFNSRIGILTPSGRKERIESLTGISDKVAEFKDKISEIKSNLSNELNELNSRISYKNGEKNSLVANINEYDSDVEITVDIDMDEFNSLKQELSKLQEYERNVSIQLRDTENDITFAESQLSKCKKSLCEDEEKLTDIGQNICPLCKSLLGDDRTDELKSSLMSSIKSNKSVITDLEEKIKELNDTADIFKLKLNRVTDELYDKNIKYVKLEKLHNEYLVNLSKIKNKELVESFKTKVFDLSAEILELENERDLIKKKYEISNHCVSLISKAFRTYLLENIIDYMNGRLGVYSSMLFSNSSDLINLKSDGNKLNICLGDALYESLSGGEKRKVDIALTIVQRDMLIDIAGVTSNIIVLDEVIDFCDETATESILSMFTSVSDTVSTMEIISHNDYNIPFDKTLTVHKTTDRQAIVEVA